MFFSSFVVSSLDRMQKVMRTKQNIELEEALLKEVSLSFQQKSSRRSIRRYMSRPNAFVFVFAIAFCVLDQQGKRPAGREICKRPPQRWTFRSRKYIAQNDS